MLNIRVYRGKTWDESELYQGVSNIEYSDNSIEFDYIDTINRCKNCHCWINLKNIVSYQIYGK